MRCGRTQLKKIYKSILTASYMKKQLHPGARWLFRIRGYFGALFLVIFLSWFLLPLMAVIGKILLGGIGALAVIVLFGFIIYIALIIIIAEIYARMAYNRWFYEFTPSNLKIERGIIWKRYSNIPYERVQNVDIHRGILARICGFSSVMIQTAGFSYSPRGGAWAEGYIPAVGIQEAEQIREFLMKKISKKGRSQGL